MDRIELHGEYFRKYIDGDAIVHKIDEMSSKLNEAYNDKNPHFLVILNGAFLFGCEIIKRFKHHCKVDFIRVNSYSGMKSTGNVIIKDLDGLNLLNKDIIVIEDLIDTGKTLSELASLIQKENPNSFSIVTLIVKEDASQFNVEPDFIGFKIPNQFIIGYGMDYDGSGRNLPHIYIQENRVV